MKYALGVFFAFGLMFAFHGAIEGWVKEDHGIPLVGAQIYPENLSVGTVSDSSGYYFLELPMHGEFRVIYQFIGFRAETVSVLVRHGERVRRDVVLKEIAIPVSGVEVQGQRQVVHESKGPEPVVVIPKVVAEQAGKTTVGEAATLETGVQLQKRCSACEASEVSIQGLPGRFSLVLLEGMPLFSNLASRYVLDLLPVEFIDRVEVLKGAAGALWGSDAVAGALNLILPEPARKVEAKASYTRRNYGNDISAMLGGNLNPVGMSVIGIHGNRDFVDRNQDGVAENTAFRRDMLLATLRYYPGIHWRFNTGVSFADELRRGGAIVADSEYQRNPLAEKVHTRRWDIWHSTGFTSGEKELRIRLAGSRHQEDGTLETRAYSAQQTTLYGELTGGVERLVSGVVVSHQRLQDNRLFDWYQESDVGIWAAGRKISLPLGPVGNDFLPALRVDFNSDYGSILSPYGALQLFFGPWDFNLAAGTGFRTPTVIFESMENLPGGYQYAIRRDTNLTRESSLSLQAGVARRLTAAKLIADLRANLFRHRVANFITAELVGIDSSSRRAVFYYSNLDEVAFSTGAEVAGNFIIGQNLSAALNGYFLVPQTRSGQILPFVKRWAVSASATYKVSRWGLEFNAAGELNGPMVVQTVSGTGGIHRHDSPVYSVMNVRLVKEMGPFRIALGVNNVWDYYQPPLSHDEKVEYYWGPIIGREFYGTLSVAL